MNFSKNRIWVIVSSIVCCLFFQLVHSEATATAIRLKKGTVATKGIVYNDDDNPIWVEYDAKGKMIIDGTCILANNEVADVPSIKAVNKDTVVSTLESSDLVPGIISREFSKDIDIDNVISQTPVDGTKAPKHSSVHYFVSYGPRIIEEDITPDGDFPQEFTGVVKSVVVNVVPETDTPKEYIKYKEQAKANLIINIDTKDLTLSMQGVDYGKINGDKTIEDYILQKGENDILFELKGGLVDPTNLPKLNSFKIEVDFELEENYTGYVQVPSFYLKKYADNKDSMKQQIEGLGLLWESEEWIDSYVEKGRVFSQSITAGEWVKPGASVKLSVSDSNTGTTQKTLGEAKDDLKDAIVMSAVTYNSYINRYYSILSEHPGQWEILTKDEYKNKTFKMADDTIHPNKDKLKNDDAFHVVVRKKEYIFDFSGGIVLMESPVNLERIEPIVLDESVTEDKKIKTLLINNDERYVLFKSVNNIGYRTAYYSDAEGWDDTEEIGLGGYNKGQDKLWGPIPNALVYSSMFYERADVTRSDGSYAIDYILPTCIGGFTYNTRLYAELAFIDFNPKTRQAQSTSYFYKEISDYCFEISPMIQPISLESITMKMAMMGTENVAEMGQQATEHNFLIDVVWVTGRAELINEQRPGILIPDWATTQGRVELKPDEDDCGSGCYTTYNSGKTDFTGKEGESTILYDFNADGIKESVTTWKREGTFRVKIWYSSNEDTATEPDEEKIYYRNPGLDKLKEDKDNDGKEERVEVESEAYDPDEDQYYADVLMPGDEDSLKRTVVRVGDYTTGAGTALDLYDRGLLKTITPKDLEKTDVYVFRESNGQLITRRTGLKPTELQAEDDNGESTTISQPATGGILDQDRTKSQIHYKIKTRGPRGFSRKSRTLDQWGAMTSMDPALWEKDADHLREGEVLKIVLLNTATGYIGTSSVILGQDGINKSNITPTSFEDGRVKLENIPMRPPNLKIRAERTWIVDSGATKDHVNENYIGFEGSALSSDEVIKITTEWYDWDGSVLPDNIKGYTGRLAKVVQTNNLKEVGDENLAHFTIKPGTHTQIIQLPKGDAQNKNVHYYIHINGESDEGKYDFETLDANAELQENHILKYRPAYYVPVQVQIYDEKSTKHAENIRLGLIRQKKEEIANSDDPHQQIDPLEFPKVDPIVRWVYRPEMQFSLYELTVGKVALADKHLGDVDNDGNEDYISYVDFLYTFVEPELDALESYNAEKKLVVAIGGSELLLNETTTGELVDLLAILAEGQDYYDDAKETDMLYKINGVDAFNQLDTGDYLTLMVYQDGDDTNVLWELEFSKLIKSKPQKINLVRKYQEARFEPEEMKFIDDPYIFKFEMLEDAIVTLKIYDEDEKFVKDLTSEEAVLKKGEEFLFYLDYAMVHDAGLEKDKPFIAILEAKVEDNSYSRKIRYEGTLDVDKTGNMLGRIMAHDVLVQDGSLNLSRQDYTINGRGPSFSFSRSYNNQSKGLAGNTLGEGWSHNFEKRLYAYEGEIGKWTSDDGLIPKWYDDVKKTQKFIRKDKLDKQEDWLLIQVNGTSFLKEGTEWKAERGRHGKLLEETIESIDYFIYVSKDGTKYKYKKPEYIWKQLTDEEETQRYSYPLFGSEALLEITDRNDNTLKIDYVNTHKTNDADFFLEIEKITDAVKRQFYFLYENVDVPDARIGGHQTRLVKVEGPVTKKDEINNGKNIVLEFSYNKTGHLKEAKRGDRIENYEYEVKEKKKDKYSYNLTKTKSLLLNREYRYEYYKDGDFDSLSGIDWIEEPWMAVKHVYYPTEETDDVATDRDETADIFAEFEYITTESKRIVMDLRKNKTEYTLNDYGNPQKIIEALGKPDIKTTTVVWSITETGKPDNVMLSKKVSKSVDGSVQEIETLYEHDDNGNIYGEKISNHVIKTDWNDFSQPTYKKDVTGVEQTWEYDAKGNLKTHKDGNDNVFTYEYDNTTGELKIANTPVSQAGSEFLTAGETTYTWDQYGNPESVSKKLQTGEEAGDSKNLITKYTYDIRGRLKMVTDPKDLVTEYTYDELDQPDKTTFDEITSGVADTHQTHIIDKDYDEDGNLIKENDKNGLTLVYKYTKRNQVKTISRIVEPTIFATKTFSYDENGNLIVETDWKGAETKYVHNPLNQKVTVINRMDEDMTMDYDPVGNLLSVTDYEDRITKYKYDVLSRKTEEVIENKGEVVSKVTSSYAVETIDEKDVYTETLTQYVSLSPERTIETKKTFDGLGNVIRQEVSGLKTYLHKWQYGPLGNLEIEEDAENRITHYHSDNIGRPVRTIQAFDADGELTTSYAYDDNGNRTDVTVYNKDSDGNDLPIVTSTDYDDWNRPVRVYMTDSYDGGLYETKTFYDGMGNSVKTIDGRGKIRTQKRDKQGRVIKEEDAEGKVTNYFYDANGNVETMTIENVIHGANTYYANDLLKQSIETNLKVISHENSAPTVRTRGIQVYDKMGNLVTTADYKGNTITTEYNGLYLPEKIYNPGSSAVFTETDYFMTGWVRSVTNRKGKTTSYEYDDFGRVTEETLPIIGTLYSKYDKVGNVDEVTDRREHITINKYDNLYRLKTVTKETIVLTTNTYNTIGQLIEVKDAKDNITLFEYNDRGFLVKTTFPKTVSDDSPKTEIRTYDGNGNVKKITNEETQINSFFYDDENRQLTVEFAGEILTNTYDTVGNLETITKDKAGTAVKIMAYDGYNRLRTVTEGHLTTNYTYDKNGNLAHIYAPGSHVEYSYDELNRKTRHIQSKNSGSLETEFTYDAEDNLKTIIDPEDQETVYGYDDLNRQIDVWFEGSALSSNLTETTHIHTIYDENNNVKTVTENKTGSLSDVTENNYDKFDRLDDTTQRGLTIDYDYDVNGNRTGVSSTAGSTTYKYDERNRLETAVADGGTTTYTYYPDSKKKTVSYPNNTKISYDYYDTNRVRTIENKQGGTVFSSYTYTYDSNGNRNSQVEVQNGTTETTTYVYDNLDRMKEFTLAAGTDTMVTTYTFENYNRKTETVSENGTVTKSRTYHYDETNWLNQIEDDTDPDPVNHFTIDYAYDNNGNTLSKQNSSLISENTSYSYDSRNQLVKVTRGPPAGETTLGRYDYNAGGLRVRHLDSERGNVDYYYDGPAVLEERNADDNSLLAHYRYADRLLSLDTGSEVQYYHHDALGSTVNLTTDTGTVKVSYWIDPYGQIRKQEGTSVNRQVFTGQEIDEKTGLVYFGARYYDPDTARFITQDSYLGESGTPPSLHRYLYAYSNPTVYVDLYGYAATIGGIDLDNVTTPELSVRNKNNLKFTKRFANARGKSRDIYSKSVGHFDLASSEAMDDLYSVFDENGINKDNSVGKALVLVEDGDGEDEVKTSALDYFGKRFQSLYKMNIGGLGDAFDDFFSGQDYKKGQILDVSQFWGVAYEGMLQNVAKKSNAMTSVLAGDTHPAYMFGAGQALRREAADDTLAPPSEQSYYSNNQFIAVFQGLSTIASFATSGTMSASRGSSSKQTFDQGVAFFGVDNLKYYAGKNVTLGSPGGKPFFFMPISDAAAVKNASDASRLTGMAPSAMKAYKNQGNIFGISFPTKNLDARVPKALDAGGWAHYLEGGNTAVRLSTGSKGGYLLNKTKEFVTPGGNLMPSGSVLFKLGKNSSWIPIRKF